ncbi:MAG: PilN domain-containing protein [Patescibacteria group bacterium]
MPLYTKALSEQFASVRAELGWPWKLLVFAGFIFSFSIFLYFGMLAGYKPFLNSRIKSLNESISQLGLAVKEEDRASFLAFYSQLVNLDKLLDGHVQGRTVFDLLERYTHPGVYYQSINVVLGNNLIRLQGVSKNYESLVEQLAIFNEVPLVERAVLDTSAAGDTGVNFTVRLTVKPAFFSFAVATSTVDTVPLTPFTK